MLMKFLRQCIEEYMVEFLKNSLYEQLQQSMEILPTWNTEENHVTIFGGFFAEIAGDISSGVFNRFPEKISEGFLRKPWKSASKMNEILPNIISNEILELIGVRGRFTKGFRGGISEGNPEHKRSFSKNPWKQYWGFPWKFSFKNVWRAHTRSSRGNSGESFEEIVKNLYHTAIILQFRKQSMFNFLEEFLENILKNLHRNFWK